MHKKGYQKLRLGLILDLGGYVRADYDEKKLYATLSKKSIESFSFWAVQLGLWFSFYWIAQSVILSRCCVPCISCLYLTQCECFVRNNTINDDAKCSFMITSSDFRLPLIFEMSKRQKFYLLFGSHGAHAIVLPCTKCIVLSIYNVFLRNETLTLFHAFWY